MADDEMPTLTYATERDIDLILIEELKCSAAFVQWLVSIVQERTGKLWLFSASRVTHSRRRIFNRREIDIHLELSEGPARSVILIENKLDTSEQPGQAESYAEECRTLLAGGAVAAVSVLVAPERYTSANERFASRFDAVITYEEIRQTLESLTQRAHGELAARLRHRVQLFDQAIDKMRRGYRAVIRPEVGAFNQEYISLLSQAFPALEPGPAMRRAANPSESVTMIFAPQVLPDWPFLPQTRLVHQLREGNVNVNFYTWGTDLPDLVGEFSKDLAGTGYRLNSTLNRRKGGSSGLMIVKQTPPVDNKAAFEFQRDAVVSGLREAEALRKWVWDNRTTLQRWAALVARAAEGHSSH